MINQENHDLYDLNEALKVENLTLNDYEEICKRLKRKPNRTELGMFGVMWSEHCCYRNSKPLLSKFPTKGKNVLVGPGENAGVIDVGNNQKLVFKIESHNHPSAIEPFQGAATGVGGILRDIFTMGARPIAVLNSLRFGNLDKSSNVDLLRGVVSGIAHYGNCVGVPTVGGEIDFDDSYSGNKLEAICIFCKNWLENDVLVGYRDIESKEVDLDSWFEDREIQEFIEKLEKKSNKIAIRSNLQSQQIEKESSTKTTEEFDNFLGNIDERKLPWPGGIKHNYENDEIKENEFNEEYFKKKPIEFYNFLIEKIAELKFSFGEFLKDKEIIYRSPYLVYIYAFLILFAFGIGIGFLRNNSKKSIQEEVIAEKPLIAKDKNQKISDKEILQEIKKNPSSKLNSIPEKSTSIISYEIKELNAPSPSLEDIRNLINGWLLSKSNYLAGKSEINLSKIVSKGLIDRTIEERQKDIRKAIYKEINSQIRKIDLESQTSSRIVVLVELNYLERILKNSGEFVNETSLNPLKVKYILGYSNKSWKLVDFVSGL